MHHRITSGSGPAIICAAVLASAVAVPAEEHPGAAVSGTGAGQAEPWSPLARPAPQHSSEIVAGLRPAGLRRLVEEVLARSPKVARARHRAAAARYEAPRVAALPDPMAAVSWFVLTPETRVGPQQWGASLSQAFPWFGKLRLKEQAALYGAVAAEAAVESARLDVLTEAQRLFFELAFLEELQAILRSERTTLARLEEASRARYAAGSGLQQEILRIQAQITRVDERMLVLREQQASLLAACNALRDRPASTPVEALSLPVPEELVLEGERLRSEALSRRPDVRAAEAEIARHGSLVELAHKGYRPDFNISLSYTRVGKREDEAGRALPPQGNGDDILMLSSSLNLPVRRGRLAAGLGQALEEQRAAEELRRQVGSEVERQVGDLTARIPYLREHWNLLQNVLLVQAVEALSSAEAAYTTGKLNAVDLLDAEVVLYQVRTGVARTSADHAIAVANLERATVRPLPAPPRSEAQRQEERP